MSRTIAAALSLMLLPSPSFGTEPLTPEQLFDARIMPIFNSPKPSSCVQCHLASVDLKDYIRPSHQATFASLRDQGLIDMDAPEKSKVLTLIKMGEKDLDQGARMIHEKTRKAELAAFTSWVEACCRDPKLRSLPSAEPKELAKPAKPIDVIRHNRKSRLVDSFARTVWSQRMRCFPCHTPFELDETNPRHKVPIQKQQEFKQQYGEELANKIQLFKETPEATLQEWIHRSQNPPEGELPLIDIKDPKRSLIVLKPTAKPPQKDADGKLIVPTASEPILHMGGMKMHHNDQAYKSFLAWIQDYANVVGNDYASVADLPADNWYPTNLFVRVADAPEQWPLGATVQVFVHGWNKGSNTWCAKPLAFTQGLVTPRRFVNGTLFLLSREKPLQKQAEFGKLPRGRYLLKLYFDSQNQIEHSPDILFGPESFVGQVQIEKARWREGFRHAEQVSAKQLTKAADKVVVD